MSTGDNMQKDVLLMNLEDQLRRAEQRYEELTENVSQSILLL